VFLDFYVAALCNLGFTICGSYTEQVWPPLVYSNSNVLYTTNPCQKSACNTQIYIDLLVNATLFELPCQVSK